jgi:hypothetical protein
MKHTGTNTAMKTSVVVMRAEVMFFIARSTASPPTPLSGRGE